MKVQTAENLSVDQIEPVELVDWFSQGESCSLQIGGTSVEVRFIGRKGRRARISVSAMQTAPVESDAEAGKDKTTWRR